MASNVPPMPPPAGMPAPKKVSPVVWILGGCLVLVVLAVGAVMLGGLFIFHKVTAGLDPEVLKRHPELAAVKLMVAANPDAELVSIDEDRGIVTVRDKKNGKTITLNFEDIKRGRMTLESEGQKVQIEGQGSGDSGSVTVKTDEGTTKFGVGAVKMPSWLPAYGNASLQGFSSQSAQGSMGSFGFKTEDAPDKVIAFYKDALERAGMKVQLMQHPAGAMVSGEAGGRKATVNVITEGGACSVTGTFEDK